MRGNPKGMIPEKVVAAVKQSRNVVLFTHTHPDGDALGSLLGLAEILESLGKKVFCFMEEPVSHLYDFLPGQQRTSIKFEEYSDFIETAGDDILAIALDCGDVDRLGQWHREFVKISPFIVIDHHQSHKNFGDMRWVEAQRSSTGEMVYELATILGADLSFDSAYNLYVAICTDTGSFRYECTGPRTLHIAAELLERGVKPAEIGSHLYDNYSKERLKLMEMVLSTISMQRSGTIAFMHVSEKMLEESGASLQDVEGFIDFPRSVRSVKVAVLIKEASKDMVSVSLRAKGECDVAEVAKRFNGGGHRNAAGFRCYGKKIEEVREEVQQVLRESLT